MPIRGVFFVRSVPLFEPGAQSTGDPEAAGCIAIRQPFLFKDDPVLGTDWTWKS
jgi:hypothetical protein